MQAIPRCRRRIPHPGIRRCVGLQCHDRAVDLRPPLGNVRYLWPFTAATLGEWSADTPADSGEVLIDMSRAQFIDCVGLATIAAVAEDAEIRGCAVRFVPPQRHSVRTYMSRMHLRECLGRFCPEVPLPSVNEGNTGNRLYELQRFDAIGGGDELAERVFRALVADGCGQADAASFFKGISEVVNNVAEHSGAGGGWTAMQVMPSSANHGLITFAVADAGHGLEITLSRSHWVDGPVDAMGKAFQRSVSGTNLAGRGTGLDDLHRRVTNHQGRLLAWSGTATGQSTLGNGPIACREVSAAFPGTVIYAGFKPEQR
jgi:hypothetical protein